MSIKAEIITRGFSTNKIAKSTGLNYETLRNMVNGKRDFSMTHASTVIEFISDGTEEDKYYLFKKYFFCPVCTNTEQNKKRA